MCVCIYTLFVFHFTLLPPFPLDDAYIYVLPTLSVYVVFIISTALPGDPDDGYQIFTENSLKKAQSLLHGFFLDPMY